MLQAKNYKNWKEICATMGWNTTGGAYKKARLKKLESLCAFDRVGQSFIIKEIYDTPKEIEDGRGKSEASRGNNNKNIKKLLSYGISYKDMNKKGVYAIILDNNIYIGSTISSFLKRYGEHKEKHNPLKTKDMVKQGATFKILQICEGMTEEQIRTAEDNWIKEYRNNPVWEVVNILEDVKIKGKHKPNPTPKKKERKRTIKINASEYDKVINLLKENGIEVLK